MAVREQEGGNSILALCRVAPKSVNYLNHMFSSFVIGSNTNQANLCFDHTVRMYAAGKFQQLFNQIFVLPASNGSYIWTLSKITYVDHFIS